MAARQLEWDKRLERFDPRDLPRLVDALLPLGRRSVEYRLPLLHARGRDPRLAAALTSWVEARPPGFQGQPTDGFWKMVLQTLEEIADVRQLPRLEVLRGFLHACRLGATPAAIDLTSCVELSTVEELTIANVESMSVGIVRTQLRLTLRRLGAGFKAEVVMGTHGDGMTDGQEAVDAAVDLAGTELALGGLERFASIELSFRPNTRGPGWPSTHLPPSEAAVNRLKSRWAQAQIRDPG